MNVEVNAAGINRVDDVSNTVAADRCDDPKVSPIWLRCGRIYVKQDATAGPGISRAVNVHASDRPG